MIVSNDADAELVQEALTIEPILSHCYNLHREEKMSASDVVGVFILSYLGLRRKKSWSNGRLKSLMSSSLTRNSTSTVTVPSSVELSSVPGLLDILCRAYVAKKADRGSDYIDDTERFVGVTVLSIFDGLQLCGIKKNADDYVNRCLVGWAYGVRPCFLMFRIPSPLEVLKQQAEGKRVITMFVTQHDLRQRHVAMLYYMEGMQNHSKDALEFLLHDMKHMENFMDPATHLEQVGFFRCMLKPYIVQAPLDFAQYSFPASMNFTDIGATTRTPSRETAVEHHSMSIKIFLSSVCGYDKQLWRELEYAISDMNCYSTHLMQYMLAKMLFASERLLNAAHFASLSTIASVSTANWDDCPAEDNPSDIVPRVSTEESKSVTEENGRVSSLLLKAHLMERWLIFLNVLGMRRKSESHGEVVEGTGNATIRDDDETNSPILAANLILNDPHSAAVGMVLTAFRERGPLTAGEGAALREFFRIEGQGEVLCS